MRADGQEATAGLTVDTVRAALRDVRYPGLTRDLVSFGMVDHVSVCGGSVKVRLALRTDDASIPLKLEAAITHILPLTVHGLSIISFGFFLGEGSPTIWRGPMVSKAVKQFALIARPLSAAGSAFSHIARGVAGALGWQYTPGEAVR